MMKPNSVEQEQPNRKKQKLSLSPISSLPDDMILSCLARLSRSDLASLYSVSNRFRSLVVSPELYKTRSLKGYKEECLYVCITTGYKKTPRWLVLSRGELKNHLVRRHIPLLPSQPTEGSCVVSLDLGIYVIGGLLKGSPTSNVFFLDSATHKWSKVSSMGVARANAAAGVVDGKIYVFGGGCKRSRYGEVFDPKTQTWDALEPLPSLIKGDDGLICESVVMNEKIYAVCDSQVGLYYSPKEGAWGSLEKDDDSRLGIYSYYCVPEGLLYGCDRYGDVYWRAESEWERVMGLEFLHTVFPNREMSSVCDELLSCYSYMRGFGGNIVFTWFKYKGNKVEIWCAEISFERCEGKDEIWGTIEWLENVAKVTQDPSSQLEVLYSTTVIM